MADIITRLKVDAQNHNQGLSQAQRALSNYAKSATSLDGIIKGAVGTLGKYVTASAAVTTALEVGKDAFFASEQNIDEWGRTTESAKAAYSVFVDTLNTGNWDGFFDRLNDAIGGAKELYDMFDLLGSTKLNNEVPIAILENQIANLKILKQQGKDVTEALKTAQEQLKKLKNEEVELSKESNAEGWYKTVKNAGGSDMSIKAFWEEYKKRGQEFYKWAEGELEQYKKKIAKTDYNYDDMGNITSKYTTYDVEKLSSLEQKRYKTLDAIVRKESELQKFQSGYANAVKQDTSNLGQEYSVNRWGKSGKSGSSSSGKGNSYSLSHANLIKGEIDGLDLKSIPEGSILEIEQMLKDAEAVYKMEGNNAGREYAKGIVEALKRELEYRNGGDPLAEITKSWKIELVDFGNGKGALPDTTKQANDTKVAWQGAASAMSSVGSALSSIEDPGLKVAGILAQAVANVALGFSNAAASPANAAGGVWTWIPAVATGLATMITTISQIKSVGKYADGGVVGGSSYAGDQLYAKVNSGETILNRVQAQNALDMMQPATIASGGNSTISGEQIVTVVRNYGKRVGHSEWLK